MRFSGYYIIILVVSTAVFASCTKVSQRNFMCECNIKDANNKTTTKEYGVYESSKINALPLCRDIENRLEQDNIERGIKETISCNIK